MQPRIGILSSQRGWHVIALEEAIRRHDATPCFFPIAHLAAWVGGGPAVHGEVQAASGRRPLIESRRERLDDCQAVLVRTIPTGSLEQIIFRMDALHRLESCGIRVVNSATAIERTVDKYYTSFLLADAGIPTPRTLVTEDFDEAWEAFHELKDVVVKPLFGSEGKGMVRVSDEDSAYRVLRSLELNRYIYYLQEFIPHDNTDVRGFVVGGQVVAAMRRSGQNWKTNFSQGARVEPVQLSAEHEALILQAARLLGADYAGVDLMTGEDGQPYILEVNSIPGWRGLSKTTLENIPDRIIGHVLQLCEPALEQP